MPELKHNFTQGRMNKDLDERIVPNGEYRDALNVEVSTSEGSDVGSVQTLKGNISLTSTIPNSTTTTTSFSDATCVGSIVNESTNKLYWFVTDKGKNQAASMTFDHVEQDSSGTVNVVHDIYSDYIMEYDEDNDETNWVVVEHWKIQTMISNDATQVTLPNGNNGYDHIHISGLSTPEDIRLIGVQPGMDCWVKGIKTKVIKIERNTTGSFNGWKIYLQDTHDSTLGSPFAALSTIVAGDTVTFAVPYNKRALGFSYFAKTKPTKLITGINIIDNLLFWTDGITEPKKINIDRCKYGSKMHDPNTVATPIYPNGTNKYYTLLYINGQVAAGGAIGNARVGSYDSTKLFYTLNIPLLPLTYRETTVIKKSPTTPLKLTMSNTVGREDIFVDGSIIVNTVITVPDSINPGNGQSSDFFFYSNGSHLQPGDITPQLTTFESMDWKLGDVIELYPDDEDAGTANDVLVTLVVSSVISSQAFKFEIQSISEKVGKILTTYKARLQQGTPLFEFKFPRFSYRWRYEDGEYSCYAPFSEIAFIPEEFDYLPKKGYNLGMTNNLRYLLLSGFKPKTMPVDVVEIDILYKESNSPNIYTVETIKSPSYRVRSLGTIDFKGDKGWFGKIKTGGSGSTWKEAPNTLSTTDYLVSTNTFVGTVQTTSAGALITNPVSGGYYYNIGTSFSEVNLKIGDEVLWPNLTSSPFTAPVVVTGITTGADPITGIFRTGISLAYGASATAITAAVTISGTGFDNGTEITFQRTQATRPAIYVDDPQGSLEIKSDMIHATVPANQLLRNFDNVPTSALAQEVTGNRVVYANYKQNYELKNAIGKTVKNSFSVNVSERRNIRDNVRYDDKSALRHPVTGETIEWWDGANRIIPEAKMPERSLKSIRDYQVGVVYMDEFGRQTPIQTNETGAFRIEKNKANKYNNLTFHLRNSLDFSASAEPTKPVWATHYKYYIKDASNEYYNLAMDRFYNAEDGNIWLSFPSSERNKVDEETFLILKKQHDNDTFVSDEDTRYKILAIRNEAPIFIKTKTDTYGTVNTTFNTSGEPRIYQSHVDVKNSIFTSTFKAAEDGENRVLRISDPTNISRFYDIVSITNTGGHRRLQLAEPFDMDMSFTTVDGTQNGELRPNLAIEVAEKKVKDLPEFEGRFFVKIYKDSILEKNILAFSKERIYTTSQTVRLGNCDNEPDERSGTWYPEPDERFWVSTEDPLQMDNKLPTSREEGTGSMRSKLKGIQDIGNKFSCIDVMTAGGGSDHYARIVGRNNSFGANARMLDQARKMMSEGQLFRFLGDSTVYRIVFNWEVSMLLYGNNSSDWWGDMHYPSNHGVGIRFKFEPQLGSSNGMWDEIGQQFTGKDAIGQPVTQYDPRTQNSEGTQGGTYGEVQQGTPWQTLTGGLDFAPYAKYQRTIEFLEEFVPDAAYTSDNPAIFETEPKENIDVDIYNEASETLPIDWEWVPYLNKFVNNTYWNSWNSLNYYNCFSFANGVESNRIRDDFNAATIDKGPKVSTVLAEQYREEHRKSGLIYSGIYNSTSGINNLNQFIQAEKITKDINPTYGSIQKLYSQDTNLITLCEDRIIKVLANKDALFNADGDANLTATNRVLGAATPYAGDYGISTDPESFSTDQYRSYFTDKSRGVVIRLSANGLQPISDMGMRDYFKDAFRARDITLLGSFDDNKRQYNLTIKENPKDDGDKAAAIVISDQTGDNANDNLTVINTGPVPTPGNALGNWFRYGGQDAWATYMESGGTCTLYWPDQTNSITGVVTPGYCLANQFSTIPQTTVGAVGGVRGWAGIRGGFAHPIGIEHGREGIIANQGLSNPITLWFNRITTGYSFTPAFDTGSNWDDLILALNANGAGNVYLYQTSLVANYPSQMMGAGSHFVNWPNNYPYAHQPETVYSIQSISYDATTEAYEVVVNWLVGASGLEDTNSFVWSLNSPFYVDPDSTTTNVVASVDGEFSDDSASESQYDDKYVNITVSFSEDSKGWTTFKSWLKESGASLNDNYFTFNVGDLYKHHTNPIRNNFYGAQYDSSLCAVFNDIPSSVKNFSSLSYEGTQSKVVANTTDGEYYNNTTINGWFADFIETDLETGFIPEFKNKEGKWFNYVKGNKYNTLSNLDVNQFSTQGIGRPSGVSVVTDPEPPRQYTLTVGDTGDTD